MNEGDIQPRDSLELRDYIAVIRSRFWVIPVTMIVVVAVFLGIALLSTPQYKATARLLYQKTNLEQAIFGSQVFANSSSNQDRDIATSAILVTLDQVAAAVEEELGEGRSASSLLDMVSTQTKTGTSIVDVVASGPDAEECAAVANSFARQFILFRQEVDRQTVRAARELVDNELASLSATERASDYGLQLKEKYDNLRIVEAMQDGGFSLAQVAQTPDTPFSPRPLRDSAIGIVLGLLGGVGLAFLLEYLDRRIKDEKVLEKTLGAPVLAIVPEIGGLRSSRGRGRTSSMRLVGFLEHPHLLESFRTLRSSLGFFEADREKSVWLVTSSESAEGKSTVAVNLAISMALTGKRVIIVDGDLRLPAIGRYLGIDQSRGLSTLLAAEGKIEDCLQMVRVDDFIPEDVRRRLDGKKNALIRSNVFVLPCGPVPPNPAELLGSSRMQKLIDYLYAGCDCIVIDGPPALAVSDAVTLGNYADGVIVVARLGSASKDHMQEVRQIFERARQRVVGAVMVGNRRGASKRYGGYGYGYGEQPAKRRA